MSPQNTSFTGATWSLAGSTASRDTATPADLPGGQTADKTAKHDRVRIAQPTLPPLADDRLDDAPPSRGTPTSTAPGLADNASSGVRI